MSDPFAGRMRRPTDPAVAIYDVTPDDAADLPRPSVALNVATPGTVRLTTVGGTTSDVTVHPGQVFQVRARRIWQTGTSATGIRALT